jgi:hypothetical protein
VSVIVTVHDNNSGGAICLPGQSGPQCSFTGISPSRQPDFTQFEYSGPPVDFGTPNDCVPGQCGGPWEPPDVPHSVPSPATLPLLVVGVALIGWLHRRWVQ